MDEDTGIISLDVLTDQQLARVRNLRPYRGKTDAEIRAIFAAKGPKKPKVTTTVTVPQTSGGNIPAVPNYDKRFREKMAVLKDEFAIDMNNSNDAESLKNLVRLQIQLENVVKQIEEIQKQTSPSRDDILQLKNLGDFQKNIMNSLAELQDKLGISRKQRKEKQVDDIPQFIDGLLTKAKVYFDKKTVTVDCPKCMVELGRYWLNFPKEINNVEMSLTCWKCKEVIEYAG